MVSVAKRAMQFIEEAMRSQSETVRRVRCRIRRRKRRRMVRRRAIDRRAASTG
jgi:hypothetical protein